MTGTDNPLLDRSIAEFQGMCTCFRRAVSWRRLKPLPYGSASCSKVPTALRELMPMYNLTSASALGDLILCIQQDVVARPEKIRELKTAVMISFRGLSQQLSEASQDQFHYIHPSLYPVSTMITLMEQRNRSEADYVMDIVGRLQKGSAGTDVLEWSWGKLEAILPFEGLARISVAKNLESDPLLAKGVSWETTLGRVALPTALLYYSTADIAMLAVAKWKVRPAKKCLMPKRGKGIAPSGTKQSPGTSEPRPASAEAQKPSESRLRYEELLKKCSELEIDNQTMEEKILSDSKELKAALAAREQELAEIKARINAVKEMASKLVSLPGDQVLAIIRGYLG